jgi:major type 1 subunit fimbrin (pilin)
MGAHGADCTGKRCHGEASEKATIRHSARERGSDEESEDGEANAQKVTIRDGDAADAWGFAEPQVIPRDVPVGSVLLNAGIAAIPSTATVYCSPSGYQTESMYAAQTTTSIANVYATNVPGIGIKVISGLGALPAPPLISSWYSFSGSVGSVWDSWGYQLIKTGPVTPGTLSFSGPVAASWVSTSATSLVGSAVVNYLYINGGANIVAPACTTPNVNVVMPSILSSVLKGVGTSAGRASFNITLNSCPAAMTSIQYEIDPATTVISSTDAVVELDGSSTASGIGVQLLDNDGNPLTAAHGFQGTATLGAAPGSGTYKSSTGGDYTIPLKARSYQTDITVGPGSVNTEMTFTMTYQ